MKINRLLSQLAVVAMQIKGALTWFTGANSGFLVLLPAGAFSHITLRNNGNGSIDCIVNGKNDEHHTIRANNPDTFDYSDITAAPDDNQATLNLSHLIDGVYFIEARTLNGSRAIKQILKQ